MKGEGKIPVHKWKDTALEGITARQENRLRIKVRILNVANETKESL